jgi:hypothetical protein
MSLIDGFFVFGHNIFIPDLPDAISGAAPGMSRSCQQRRILRVS